MEINHKLIKINNDYHVINNCTIVVDMVVLDKIANQIFQVDSDTLLNLKNNFGSDKFTHVTHSTINTFNVIKLDIMEIKGNITFDIEDLIYGEIKRYRNNLATDPNNKVYFDNSLLIDSCYAKAMTIIESCFNYKKAKYTADDMYKAMQHGHSINSPFYQYHYNDFMKSFEANKISEWAVKINEDQTIEVI